MLAYSERLPSGEKWEMHTRSEKEEEEEFIYFFRQTLTQNKIEKKEEIPRKQHLKT